MLISGVDVDAENVEWLRTRVDEPTASILSEAIDQNSVGVGRMSFEDRERMLAVLDVCPVGLADLRDALLRERKYRRDQRI
jgi:hypothetical protein